MKPNLDLNVYSMTGFGSAEVNSTACKLTLQLKSVNSRFLDLSFKIPEELATHESLIRDSIFTRVKRGKIECKISWQSTQSVSDNAPQINTEALQQVLDLQSQILKQDSSAQPMSITALLNWPGVLPSSHGATSALAQVQASEMESVTHTAISALLASRAAEGAHLSNTLNERLDAIATIIAELRVQLPELLAHQENKLRERLLKAIDAQKADVAIATSAIPAEELIERIRQEASLTAIRIDVAEELDRLDGHIASARKILKNGGSIGKKLDFLMQEFNREANTLGSKSASLLQTQASMDLKLIIEQMREQVQNIE
ncbi:YicC/YloC family endoribonuclease [Hydromonas duriensis]|uniref:Uncharacterized protein (TIGR00255 family) n=1 Tax=Hydromonas duriensis TaxID=1527608 RepID=A0A4R6Y4F5_9BURK|nr:YicC/YloC family endoribonuclease [Hydromonas duriensis]TDR28870.1 uncharacterized protein (TIGR00255 family) [Hydromonas duriensis]